MSDFRVKLLGLAAVASVFAGMSYGQVSCATVPGGTTNFPSALNTSSPILDRAESEADLVSDIILYCPNSGAVSNGQLTVFSSLPVSSKVVTGTTTSGSFVAGGNSEAILQICPPQGPGASFTTGCTNTSVTPAVTVSGTTLYQGTVSGSIISFAGVSFPAGGFTAQVSNFRVNLSGAAIGSTPTPITASVFAGTNGLATVVYNNLTVGYGLKSLVTPFLVPISPVQTSQNYTVCSGNSSNGINPAFTVSIGETFGGFFKTQTGVSSSGTGVTVLQNGEQGSLTSGASAAIGTAASGTEFTLTIGNLPSVATVYVQPTIQTSTPVGATTATITLTGNPTIITGSSGTPWLGLVAFTPSSGTVTVTYQVVASNAAQVETFQVPVSLGFAPNAAAAQGPVTVLAAYAPAAALTGQATSVPDFAPSSNTPLNASVINICQTSLLFPFVTNQLGFDTGLVLSNTSTDPFATGTSATPQAGTCTLNFYGAGAPTGGSAPAPGGSQATATTNAFLLSSVAPGFQGYMIAVCTYLYGHGFAYIAYDLTQNNGATMGYVADVMEARPNQFDSDGQ